MSCKQQIYEPPNYRLKLTARLFLAERPQLSQSVRRIGEKMTDHIQKDWFSAISLLIEASKNLELLLGKDWTKKLYNVEAQTIEVENSLDKYDKAFLTLRSCLAPHTVIPGVESCIDDIEGWRDLGKRENYPVIDKLRMARDHYDEVGRDYNDDDGRECADLITLLLDLPFFKPDNWFKKEDNIEMLYIKGADIPPWLSNRYREALYAYVYGFNNAAVALCRTIIEGVLKDKLEEKNITTRNKTIEEMLKYAVDLNIIDGGAGTVGDNVRELGNIAFHELSKSYKSGKAMRVILKTKDFIEKIY